MVERKEARNASIISRFFILSLVATAFVVGAYLLVFFQALWFGEADILAPLKMAFLIGAFMLFGHMSLTVLKALKNHEYSGLWLALPSLVGEIFTIWLVRFAMLDFLFNMEVLVSLTNIADMVRVLTTFGLGTILIFLLLTARFVVVQMGLDRLLHNRLALYVIVLTLGSLFYTAAFRVNALEVIGGPFALSFLIQIVVSILAAVSALDVASNFPEETRKRKSASKSH